MWLKHSDLFLLWSKDLMPAQGVSWSLSLPNSLKSPLCPTATVLHVSKGNFCCSCTILCF